MEPLHQGVDPSFTQQLYLTPIGIFIEIIQYVVYVIGIFAISHDKAGYTETKSYRFNSIIESTQECLTFCLNIKSEKDEILQSKTKRFHCHCIPYMQNASRCSYSFQQPFCTLEYALSNKCFSRVLFLKGDLKYLCTCSTCVSIIL